MATVHLSVRTAWWLRYYIMGIVLAHQLTGMEPNWTRIQYWIGKALKPECRRVDG